MVSHNESGLQESVNGDVALYCEHVRNINGVLCFEAVSYFLGISNEECKDTGKIIGKYHSNGIMLHFNFRVLCISNRSGNIIILFFNLPFYNQNPLNDKNKFSNYYN